MGNMSDVFCSVIRLLILSFIKTSHTRINHIVKADLLFWMWDTRAAGKWKMINKSVPFPVDMSTGNYKSSVGNRLFCYEYFYIHGVALC